METKVQKGKGGEDKDKDRGGGNAGAGSSAGQQYGSASEGASGGASGSGGSSKDGKGDYKGKGEKHNSGQDREVHGQGERKERKHSADRKHHHKNKERRGSKDEKKGHKDHHHKAKKKSKDRDREKEKEKQHQQQRVEKDKARLKKIEEAIRRKASAKEVKTSTGSFKNIDMFAPKPVKPKLQPTTRTPGTPSTTASPFTFAVKSAPPPLATPSAATKTPTVSARKDQPPVRRLSLEQSKAKLAKRSVPPEDTFVVEKVPEAKVYPHLPVPKDEGDKAKQYEQEQEEAKRRLKELRERKLREKYMEDEMRKRKKELKRMNSSMEKKMKPERTRTPDMAQKATKRVPKGQSPLPPSPEKKKLTMADLQSDEDEVSDWSGDESSGKVRRAASTEKKAKASERVHRTRKTNMETQSEAILASDPATAKLNHFDDGAAEEAVRKAKAFADVILDEDAISVSSGTDEDEGADDDLIYLNGPFEGGAAKAVETLARAAGGRPAVVKAVPHWLKAWLDGWWIQRHAVNIHYYPDDGYRPPKGKVVKERAWLTSARKNLADHCLPPPPEDILPKKRRRLATETEAATAPKMAEKKKIIVQEEAVVQHEEEKEGTEESIDAHPKKETFIAAVKHQPKNENVAAVEDEGKREEEDKVDVKKKPLGGCDQEKKEEEVVKNKGKQSVEVPEAGLDQHDAVLEAVDGLGQHDDTDGGEEFHGFPTPAKEDEKPGRLPLVLRPRFGLDVGGHTFGVGEEFAKEEEEEGEEEEVAHNCRTDEYTTPPPLNLKVTFSEYLTELTTPKSHAHPLTPSSSPSAAGEITSS